VGFQKHEKINPDIIGSSIQSGMLGLAVRLIKKVSGIDFGKMPQDSRTVNLCSVGARKWLKFGVLTITSIAICLVNNIQRVDGACQAPLSFVCRRVPFFPSERAFTSKSLKNAGTPAVKIVARNAKDGRRKPALHFASLPESATVLEESESSFWRQKSNTPKSVQILQTIESLTKMDHPIPRGGRLYQYVMHSKKLQIDNVGEVSSFLLRLFDEDREMANEVLCLYPRILRRSVETQLQPTLSLLEQLYGAQTMHTVRICYRNVLCLCGRIFLRVELRAFTASVPDSFFVPNASDHYLGSPTQSRSAPVERHGILSNSRGGQQQ
jgi:hypothetical protein